MTIDWEKASKELAKPLDPSAIKPPPQGKFGEYVDGLHVISEANRIFGRNGWSYTVTRLECASNDIFDTHKGPQARVAYVCAVRVDVGGVIREGLACGTGNGKPENIGDVIESAVKEAETDALKRALRSFGNTFGLALYEKDKSKREVAAPTISEDQFIALRDLVDVADANLAAMLKHYGAETLEQFPLNRYAEAVAALNKKIEKARSADLGGDGIPKFEKSGPDVGDGPHGEA